MSHGAYQTFADHYGLDAVQFVMGMTPSSDSLGTKGLSHQNAPYEFLNTDYAHLRSEPKAIIPGNPWESHGHLDATVHGYIGGKPLGRTQKNKNAAMAGRHYFDSESSTGCRINPDEYVSEQTTMGGLPHAFDASQRPDVGGWLGYNSNDSKRLSHYHHAIQYRQAVPIDDRDIGTSRALHQPDSNYSQSHDMRATI